MKELSSSSSAASAAAAAAAAAASPLSSTYYTLKAALVISGIRTQWFLDVHTRLTFLVSDEPRRAAP